MKKIREDCAGIDIGARKIFVSIEKKDVLSFDTFTSSFNEAKDYLLSNNVKSVAMEATGVYWVVLYDILEAAGLDVWLVDGKQTKQVPGRKTDVKDCQWIQQLHSYGLLNRCFVPNKQIIELRKYQRTREDHIRSAATSINLMQKSLIEMNVRLTEVLSQIHGSSGLKMIEAILAGERDKYALLELCHLSLKKTKSDLILNALEGHYTEAGIFTLQQAYNTYQFYQQLIRECDFQIQKLMEKINDYNTSQKKKEKIESVKKRKPIRHNSPNVNHLGGHLLNIFEGKDATILPGFTDYTWLQLYSETGSDLTKWDTHKHFTSWLGLAPGQNNSGKMKKNKNKKAKPKAGQIFRQIAQSIIESKNIGLGAFGRRIKSRRGPSVAVKATARKLAELYWKLMVKGLDFVENGVKTYELKIKQQEEKWIKKKASKLGYQLIIST